MSDFQKNFTYCVKLDFYKPKENRHEIAFVTEVDNNDKTFKWKTDEQLQGKTNEILVFTLSKAVDLMNCMTCNGYVASIQPMFKDDTTKQQSIFDCKKRGENYERKTIKTT